MNANEGESYKLELGLRYRLISIERKSDRHGKFSFLVACTYGIRRVRYGKVRYVMLLMGACV